jgi:hypothetical protein
MTAPGVPLTAINGGMNRLRVKGAARKDTLYLLKDAYVTAGNTIKPRGGTIRNVDLSATTGAGMTKGLVAHQGQLHVFSSVRVAVPAGYVDHVLSHPAVQATYTPPFPGSNTSWNPIVESLLHFEDGNGSTVFTDSGTSPAAWTANGAAESTVQAKFGTGSLAFTTGSSGRTSISALATGSLDLFTSAGDWTIEFWLYPTAAAITGSVFAYDSDTTQAGKGFELHTTSSGTSLSLSPATQNTWFATTITNSGLVANAWNHIAITREGDNGVGAGTGINIRLYVNGALTGGSIGFPTAAPPAPSIGAKVWVGGTPNFGGSAATFYVDEVRITKGNCIYGGPFTPSTIALTTTPVVPYTIDSLIHFEDGAGSTAFTDAAAPAWTHFGAASEVLSPHQLGAGSGAFLNVADYITSSAVAGGAFDFANKDADFTIECFVYPTDVTGGVNHCWLDLSHRTSVGGSATLVDLRSISHDLKLKDWNTGSTITATNAFPTANIWYHVAIVRYGQTYLLFVNGVRVGASAISTVPMPTVSTGAHWYMGADGFNGTQSAAGYIDEFRAIRGLALYIANFTPPAAPYTAPGFAPIDIKEIHFAAPFMGFLYVVAEFVQDGGSGLGTVFHYWLQTSGTWLANTLYKVGQIISPTVANGLQYRAERVSTPNPKWAVSTLKAVNDIVEPTVPNGFLYTVTAVDGSNPITGTVEPTWPTTPGTTVFEESEKADTGEVAGPAPQPSSTTPSPGTGGKYGNPYKGVF